MDNGFDQAFPSSADAASHRPDAGGAAPTTLAAYRAPDPGRLPTRDEVRAMRLQEKAGIPFWLKWTGVEATVRMLSLADKAMLAGLPRHVEVEIKDAYQKNASRSGANKTLDDVLRTAEGDERLANACCVAGFVTPRLVLTEDDRDPNDPECWVVTDLHIEERREYLMLVLGRAPEEVVRRVQSFRAEAVAGG